MVNRLNLVQLSAQSIVTSKMILFFVKSLNLQGKPNLTDSYSKMKLCKSRLYTKLFRAIHEGFGVLPDEKRFHNWRASYVCAGYEWTREFCIIQSSIKKYFKSINQSNWECVPFCVPVVFYCSLCTHFSFCGAKWTLFFLVLSKKHWWSTSWNNPCSINCATCEPFVQKGERVAWSVLSTNHSHSRGSTRSSFSVPDSPDTQQISDWRSRSWRGSPNFRWSRNSSQGENAAAFLFWGSVFVLENEIFLTTGSSPDHNDHSGRFFFQNDFNKALNNCRTPFDVGQFALSCPISAVSNIKTVVATFSLGCVIFRF